MRSGEDEIAAMNAEMWMQFSLDGWSEQTSDKRGQELVAIMDKAQAPPTSEEAMQHLQACYDGVMKAISNVRMKAVQIRRSGKASQAQLTIADTAKDMARMLEAELLPKVVDTMMRAADASDGEVKTVLSEISPAFSELVGTEKELTALMKCN